MGKVIGQRTMESAPEELKRVLNELMAGLKPLYGDHLVHVVLYGSYARGDATPDSDVDLVLVVEGLERREVEMEEVDRLLAEMNSEYEHLFSVVVLNRVSFEKEDSPFLSNVRREGVLVG